MNRVRLFRFGVGFWSRSGCGHVFGEDLAEFEGGDVVGGGGWEEDDGVGVEEEEVAKEFVVGIFFVVAAAAEVKASVHSGLNRLEVHMLPDHLLIVICLLHSHKNSVIS